MLFYHTRWYDPAVGRFLQADTLVPSPGDPQSLNRYAYTLNNLLRYTDPTGHAWRDDDSGGMWRWWEIVPQPSIHDIGPGGDYVMGTVSIGPKDVSVYLPPLVTGGSTSEGLIPVYGAWNNKTLTDPDRKACYAKAPYSGPSIHAAPAGDYWYGEEVNGGSVVRPNAWRNLAVIHKQELPNRAEALAGIVQGLNNSPEDLPLEPNAPCPAVLVNGGQLLAYGWQGHAQAQWITDFYLQEHVSRVEYRAIILTRQLSMDESMYRTSSGLYPRH